MWSKCTYYNSTCIIACVRTSLSARRVCGARSVGTTIIDVRLVLVLDANQQKSRHKIRQMRNARVTKPHRLIRQQSPLNGKLLLLLLSRVRDRVLSQPPIIPVSGERCKITNSAACGNAKLIAFTHLAAAVSTCVVAGGTYLLCHTPHITPRIIHQMTRAHDTAFVCARALVHYTATEP